MKKTTKTGGIMRLSVTLAMACASISILSAAEPAQGAISQSTYIPAQALGTALQTLAKQRGFQVVYFSDAVDAMKTEGASGDLTPDEALKQLVRGTGLSYRYLDDSTVTIYPADMPQAMGGSSLTTPSQASPGVLRVAQIEGSTESSAAPLSNVLSTVTVTARRRDETVQEVPLSVQAFSAEEIEVKGIERIENVLQSTPNVMISSSLFGQADATFSMRGIPRAGLFVDGVFQQTAVGFGQRSLAEVERVEILRGPQGTLFGRDSTGGAVRIFTQLPAADFGVRTQATVGDYNRRDLLLHADLPVSDTLRTKFSFSSETRDGYMKSLVTGRATGEIDDQSARADFLWLPNDKFTARLWGDKSRQRGTQPYSLSGLRDFGPPGPSPGNGLTVPQYQSYEALGVPVNCQTSVTNCPGGQVGDLETMSNYDGGPGVMVDSRSINLKLDYNFTDNVALNSLTSYNKTKSSFYSDFDSTFVDYWDELNAEKRDSWSQEFQLTADFGRLHTVTGVYGWDTSSKRRYFTWQMWDFDCGVGFNSGPAGVCSPTPRFSFEQLAATPACSGPVTINPATGRPNAPCGRGGPLVGADQFSGSEQDGYAIFGEYTLDITRTLSATVGARYHQQTNQDWTLAFAPDTARRSNTPGHLPGGDLWVNAGKVNPIERSFNKATYRAALTNKFTDDLMVYAGFSQGYNGGGVSRVIVPDGQGATFAVDFPYEPETIDNYEVGLRSDWLNRTLRLNLTVFHTEWQDIQFGGTVNNPFTGEQLPRTLIRNAASAEAEGVELEATWLPIDGLQLNLAMGVLDTGYTDIAVDGDLTKNAKFGMAPEQQGNFGAQYSHSLGGGGSLLYRADVSYTSGFNRQYSPLRQRGTYTGEKWDQDAYSLLQARIMYTAASDRWSVALFGTNLTDERYVTGGFMSNLVLFDMSTVGRPREFGLTFRANFD